MDEPMEPSEHQPEPPRGPERSGPAKAAALSKIYLAVAGIVVVTVLIVFGVLRPLAARKQGMGMAGHEMGSPGMGTMVGVIPVTVEPATRGELSQRVRYTGSVRPLYEEVVYPRVEGWIRRILVDERSKVRAGQVMVQLDDVELRARAEAARAAYDGAQQAAGGAAETVRQMRAKLAEDQQGLSAQEALLKQSFARLDQQKAALAQAVAAKSGTSQSLREAQAMVSSRQSELDRAHGELSEFVADRSEAQNSLREAQAGLTRAERELDATRSEVDEASAARAQADNERLAKQADLAYWQAEWDRRQQLFAAKAVSAEERDAGQASHETAVQMVAQAENRVREVEASIAKARARVQQAEAAIQQADAVIGQSRARIDGAESRISQHQAHVEAMGADVEAARAAANRAQSDVDAAQAMVDQAQAMVDEARSAVEEQQFRVRQAQAVVDQSRAAVLQAEAGMRQAQAEARGAFQEYQAQARVLSYTTIRAETSGTVSRRMVDKGTLVSAGIPLLKIATDNAVRIQVNVAEEHVPRLRVGSRAFVKTSAFPDQEFLAHVTTIFPEEDPKTRTGIVEIVLDNPGNRIPLESYTQCELEIARHVDVITVPKESVQQLNGRPVVYVAERGTPKARPASAETHDMHSSLPEETLPPGIQLASVGSVGEELAPPVRERAPEGPNGRGPPQAGRAPSGPRLWAGCSLRSHSAPPLRGGSRQAAPLQGARFEQRAMARSGIRLVAAQPHDMQSPGMTHEGMDHATEGRGDDGGAELRTIYTCTMHPEVREDKPGKCPKCGMTLIPQTVGTTGLIAVARDVQTGIDDGRRFEIISGISEGEQVIVQGAENVVDGAPVRIVEELKPVLPISPEQAEREREGPVGEELAPLAPTPAPVPHKHAAPEAPPGASVREGLAPPRSGRGVREQQAAPLQEPTLYTCPMHPEVRQSSPGTCPKCGMTLEPVGGSAKKPAPPADKKPAPPPAPSGAPAHEHPPTTLRSSEATSLRSTSDTGSPHERHS